MCGIAGFSLAPGSTFPVKEWSHQMLMLNEERGESASGWAYMVGKDVFYKKGAVKGRDLRVREIDAATKLAILHTRNMTKGPVEVAGNNHPIISRDGTITVIHNGVIENDEDFRDYYKDLPEVDSAVIPELLAEFGVDGLTQLSNKSWAALGWFDTSTPDTLHLAVTQGAPLILVGLKDGSTLFGSTWEAILTACQRVHVADQITFAYAVPEWNHYELQDGRIMFMENLNPWSFATQLDQFKKKAKYAPQTPAAKAAETKRLADLKAVTEGKATVAATPNPTSTKGSATPSTTSTPATGSGSSYSPGGYFQAPVNDSSVQDSPFKVQYRGSDRYITEDQITWTKCTYQSEQVLVKKLIAEGKIQPKPSTYHHSYPSGVTTVKTVATYPVESRQYRTADEPSLFEQEGGMDKIAAMFAAAPKTPPSQYTAAAPKAQSPAVKRGNPRKGSENKGELSGEGSDLDEWLARHETQVVASKKYWPYEMQCLGLWVMDISGEVIDEFETWEEWTDVVEYAKEHNELRDFGFNWAGRWPSDIRGDQWDDHHLISSATLWDTPAIETKIFEAIIMELDDITDILKDFLEPPEIWREDEKGNWVKVTYIESEEATK